MLSSYDSFSRTYPCIASLNYDLGVLSHWKSYQTFFFLYPIPSRLTHKAFKINSATFTPNMKNFRVLTKIDIVRK